MTAPASTVVSRSRALVASMQVLADAHDRLAWLVARARRAPVLPSELRMDAFKIDGCISELWLVPAFAAGRVQFRTDAAAAIPKGIAAALAEVYSDGTPAEILGLGDDFIRDAGLPQVLSPNRSNGLAQLVARIRAHARTAGGLALHPPPP